ncbi:MAG: phosphoglycerate kinase [archaeon]|nr:phosphoglycerate kinase [archaeon]
MKKIYDYDLGGKKVIIRVDFNVPIKDGVITDDNRIKKSLKTINYALEKGAKVLLLSHLGRVKEESDLAKNDLSPVAKRLEELLGRKVTFINATRGEEVENALNDNDLVLLQNTRYEDLDGEKESKNDPELGAYWASLGDLYINDAFGTSHRAHASNVGIASHLPSGIGFLVEKELDNIMPVLENPERPFTVILGGSKVSDKIGVIENLIDKADNLLIGGGMAYTFLKSKGENIGKSLVEDDKIDYCIDLLKKSDRIIIPKDHKCAKNIESSECYVKDVMDDDDIALDIGPKTVEEFKDVIRNSKTIIWNGPLGMFENPLYKTGTEEICKTFTKDQTVIVGGGDSASAVINLGYKDNVTHISTGGGASLELLEGKVLPGISSISE